MPAYKITHFKTHTRHLVIADNQSQALRFIAGSQYKLEVLKGQDVAELVASGLKVEDARKAQQEMNLDPEPRNGSELIIRGSSDSDKAFDQPHHGHHYNSSTGDDSESPSG